MQRSPAKNAENQENTKELKAAARSAG